MLELVRKRALALGAIRTFFAERNFLEVDAPLLVKAPSLEVHLRPIQVGARWLITSPEFQMKRLLVAGAERIFSLCKCFRDEEIGRQHSQEFTMLEWYRSHSDLDAILQDTQELCAAVATAVRGRPEVSIGERRFDVSPGWPVMSIGEAMRRFADVAVAGDETAEELARRVRAAGIDIGSATAWDDIFFTAFVERVEPALARMERPVVINDWPLPLAALARRRPGNLPVAERFEVYIGGIELANAFGELTCPEEQRRRFEAENVMRADRGLPVYPLDEKFLAALDAGMPPSGGIALGVDRLLMLAFGADDIADVQLFADREL